MTKRGEIKRARRQFEQARELYNQQATDPAAAARHLSDMANAALITGDPRHSREVNDITTRAASRAAERIAERDRQQQQDASWDTGAPADSGVWVGGQRREPDADGTVRITGEAVSGAAFDAENPPQWMKDDPSSRADIPRPVSDRGTFNAGIIGDGITVTNSAIGVNATVVNHADGITETYGGGNPAADMEAGE